MVKLDAERFDICVDKFDCYCHRHKCLVPLKDSEPNVSESHFRTNIDYFQQFRIFVYICVLSEVAVNLEMIPFPRKVLFMIFKDKGQQL